MRISGYKLQRGKLYKLANEHSSFRGLLFKEIRVTNFQQFGSSNVLVENIVLQNVPFIFLRANTKIFHLHDRVFDNTHAFYFINIVIKRYIGWFPVYWCFGDPEGNPIFEEAY